MKPSTISLAGALLLLSAGVAAAAPATVTNDLNLRSGPGTGYGVIDTLPAGSSVDVLGCNGSWCRVATAEGTGFASGNFLDMDGGAYAAAPGAVEVEPGYTSDYDYEPGSAWGWGPTVGIGFGGYGWHRGWHHGYRDR
ncbi:MAG: SH3 domain-containing protein [Pseudolabrys sp.]